MERGGVKGKVFGEGYMNTVPVYVVGGRRRREGERGRHGCCLKPHATKATSWGGGGLSLPERDTGI